MLIKEALIWANNKLKNLDSPQLDAEVLLSFILKKNKFFLYTYPEKKLNKLQLNKFKFLINKRKKNYPVAYLTNNKEFFGINFYVDNRVLIPRPETEILVEQTISLIKKNKLKTVADIGTGSGCIAISVKKSIPSLTIYASDINKKALAVAKKNSKLNKTKIIFKQGYLLTPYKHIKIDIILANLPYLSKKLYQNVNSFEPKTALFAKKNGIEYIEGIIKQLTELDFLPKFLVLEIDPNQTKKILKILTNLNYQTKITKDLQSLNRTLTIKIK